MPIELTERQRDSIMHAEARLDSIKQAADSLKNDPHKREYYLSQIPFTAEQLEASNKILEEVCTILVLSLRTDSTTSVS